MLAEVLDMILCSQRIGEKTDTKIDDIAHSLDMLCKVESTKENLLAPLYDRKLNLTCKCRTLDVYITSLYCAATAGRLDLTQLLHSADAMLNLEGGMEGTPLMGACRTERLDVVRYLVRNGAILSYSKRGVQFNAFDKAASYPKIQRWFLVERFTEQRMIAAGESAGDDQVDVNMNLEEEATYTYTDDIADVTLDLVLEDDLEQYLESKNWFLPMRRFIDNGNGAFERIPIIPEEFLRYRPLSFKVSSG